MKRLHLAWVEFILTCAEVVQFVAPRTWLSREMVCIARSEHEAFKTKWGCP